MTDLSLARQSSNKLLEILLSKDTSNVCEQKLINSFSNLPQEKQDDILFKLEWLPKQVLQVNMSAEH